MKEGVGRRCDQTEEQAAAELTFKVKEKVWPLIELCASEQF